MEEECFSKQIINSLREIIPLTYEFVSSIDGYASFQKIENDKILVIGMGSILKGYFQGISSSISFIKIEEILFSEFKKNPNYNNGTTLTTRQHGLIFNFVQGDGIYNRLPLSLDNDEAINDAKILIEKFINEYSNPFFDYWKDIRCFLPFLENEDGIRLNDFFSGYPTERKMIIWHLCNHPNSKEHITKIIESWEKYSKDNPDDIFTKKQFKNMQRIVKELNKTPPIL